MDLQLTGKRALVTGASRGIGKEIARALAAEGADVVVASRGLEALQAAAAEIAQATGRRVEPIAADTGDDASVLALVSAAVAAFGGVDILVNNAAAVGGGGGSFPNMASDKLIADLNVKVAGYMRTAQAAAPHMIAGGWGRIINIGGVAARMTYNPFGSMRNAAISALSANLANELGPKGVTVNTVHPGFTMTERSSEAFEKRAIELNTIGRAVHAREVAWLVTMLASPLCGAINGETILGGGGLKGAISY
ncbi:MAG: SDR family oxidoreductase [Phenylobacterium sp.]|uniref:SDR family NAD(P)-dependent oxidoreductase n=1 Tax=Phenylobacterium sp. TaxID=1871053 RepID=UPI0027367E4F|nr:SDR family NAD(P)-dependent oxidoreductase [Phenylobacterium sp.]MDP3175868.1 SDR family oxidoreductase [Phenylobacterium sp.]